MLARKVFASSAIFSISRFAGRGLDIFAALVMARFLSPADFGVVTLGLAALMILESFSELPVADALVREKELRRAHLDTAFTLSFLRGIAIAAVLILASYPMALIYDDQRLVLLICLLALAPLAKGLLSPLMVKFTREVNYQPTAIIDVTSRIVAFVLAVICAWWTESYLSLVVLSVTPQVIQAVVTYIWAPYRPRFCLSETRTILSFAGMVTISRVLATLSSESDRFLIGGFISKSALGFFSMGRSVATTASWAVAMPLITVLYPGLSKVRDDEPRFRRSYLRGQAMVVMAIMPLSLTLALLAEPLVRLGLGEEWMEVVPVMRALALVGTVATLSMPAQAIALTLNQPRQLIWREAATLIVSLPTVVLGAIYYGLMGAVMGRVLASLIHTIMSLEMVSRLSGITIMKQITNVWRTIVASAVFSLFLYFAAEHLTGGEWLYQLLALAVTGIIGVAIFAATHLVLWKLSGSPDTGPEHFAIEQVQHMLSRFRKPKSDPARS
ncbi:lipopolysaccharide biosynthesis protein [Croceicoccus mobilis]|uniref:Lipopolysaccharide biosynthesis protein n=1 Tax=Croceicoccus mobilis TaxID=1703339 RepID=A0A917DUG8_9SPHN|nr:lipopolysaccharide biosynthesis protein [Croceicoccus mobilis]GGD72148.1 lipopolysaccharide biosynthesis protein [Croceicoccus mobilis]